MTMAAKLALIVRTDLGMGRGKIAAQVAHAAGLPVELIQDAGRTQVAPGTLTCCAVGPADSARVDPVTAELTLL